MKSSLLPLSAFQEITALLANKTIVYTKNIGNVGDELIHIAQLAYFQRIGARLTNEWAKADCFVYGGGGALGTLYGPPYPSLAHRQHWLWRAASLNLPSVILPQTYTGGAETYPPKTTVFVRDRISKFLMPDSPLAPDMVLGYEIDKSEFPNPVFVEGVFLRGDLERSVVSAANLGDPIKLCQTVPEYLQLVARYERLVTNRLHFAIAGLMLGREVTILPNSYYKNRAMYETWLKALGCKWADEWPPD